MWKYQIIKERINSCIRSHTLGVNDTVLLLINGTKATDITLLPKLCLKVCGTIDVLIKILVCTTSLLVVSTNESPERQVCDLF